MHQFTLTGMFLGSFLFFFGGILAASEADELRERANGLRKKAAVLVEQGNRELAERLLKESAELFKTAERMESKARERGETQNRPDVQREVNQLKERLRDGMAMEQKMLAAMLPDQEIARVREKIAATKRELQQILAKNERQTGLDHGPGREFQKKAEGLAIAGRHILNLRIAAQNLKMAEEHDLAVKVMEKAEAMEKEVQKNKERLAAEMRESQGAREEPNAELLKNLKNEIEKLRAEVRDLRQKAEKR